MGHEKCVNCKRKLNNSESQKIGIGPECKGKVKASPTLWLFAGFNQGDCPFEILFNMNRNFQPLEEVTEENGIEIIVVQNEESQIIVYKKVTAMEEIPRSCKKEDIIWLSQWMPWILPKKKANSLFTEDFEIRKATGKWRMHGLGENRILLPELGFEGMVTADKIAQKAGILDIILRGPENWDWAAAGHGHDPFDLCIGRLNGGDDRRRLVDNIVLDIIEDAFHQETDWWCIQEHLETEVDAGYLEDLPDQNFYTFLKNLFYRDKKHPIMQSIRHQMMEHYEWYDCGYFDDLNFMNSVCYENHEELGELSRISVDETYPLSSIQKLSDAKLRIDNVVW